MSTQSKSSSRCGLTRRRVLGASSLAATSVALAACGPDAGGSGAGGEGATAAPATVTLWDREEQSYQPFIEQWLPLFKARHPKITVQYEPRPPSWGEKLTTAIVAGTPPDVAAVFGSWFRDLQQNKQVLALDKYIKASNFDAGDFVPGVYRGMNWDGSQVGIPQYLNTNTVYYNKDTFRRMGVPFPSETWTHDQFLDAAQKLTRGPLTQREVWGLSVGWGSITGRAISLAWGQGAHYNDPKNPSLFTLNTPPNVRAVQWVHDIPWKLHVGARTNEDRGGVSQTQAVFVNGNVAMMIEGTHILAEWKDKAQADWDVAPLPRGPGGRGERLSMDGYIIPTGVKTPDASWAVLQAITDKEANRLRAEINGFVPARKSQFDVWAKSIPGKALKNALPSDEARPDPGSLWPQAREVGNAINPIWQRLFDKNEIGVPDALKQAQEAVVGVLGPSASR